MTTAFRDPDVEPTATRIRAALGPAGDVWDSLTDLIEQSGLTLTWRYYRDGGWLARAGKGSRSIAWLNVASGCAKATFYFSERDRAGLVESAALAADLRGRIAAVPLIGKLLPVSLEVRGSQDVREVATVLGLKLGGAQRGSGRAGH